MNNCLNCGGAILEQGSTYGYSGKICYCLKDYQRPSILANEIQSQIEKLTAQRTIAIEALKECEHYSVGIVQELK